MEQYEPDSSELEVSTTAGDGAEDLEFGKGEGGLREGAEDTGPRKGTIAPRPMELIDNAGSWDSLMPCQMIWSRVFSLATAQLNCTGSDLKLHFFDGVVIIEIVDWEERIFSYVHRTSSFLPLLKHFCQGAVLISSLSMSGCATSFPKNPNHIDRVNHVNHRHIFF